MTKITFKTELRSKDECIKFIHDLCRADRDFHFDEYFTETIEEVIDNVKG